MKYRESIATYQKPQVEKRCFKTSYKQKLLLQPSYITSVKRGCLPVLDAYQVDPKYTKEYFGKSNHKIYVPGEYVDNDENEAKSSLARKCRIKPLCI